MESTRNASGASRGRSRPRWPPGVASGAGAARTRQSDSGALAGSNHGRPRRGIAGRERLVARLVDPVEVRAPRGDGSHRRDQEAGAPSCQHAGGCKRQRSPGRPRSHPDRRGEHEPRAKEIGNRWCQRGVLEPVSAIDACSPRRCPRPRFEVAARLTVGVTGAIDHVLALALHVVGDAARPVGCLDAHARRRCRRYRSPSRAGGALRPTAVGAFRARCAAHTTGRARRRPRRRSSSAAPVEMPRSLV